MRYNELTVASGFDVNLIAAARLGDVLTASGAVKSARPAAPVCTTCDVRNQRGEPVAAFRGRSYSIKGKALVEGLPVGRQG